MMSIAIRVAWWVAPRIIAGAVDLFEKALLLVETAQTIEDPTARRKAVLDQIGGSGLIPEPALRFLVEFCVILNRLGVTSSQLDAMEGLVRMEAIEGLADGTKRQVVLQQFAALFPELPERIGRLLLELAVAKARLIVMKKAA